MLTELNSPYARHTDVRGLPVPLWRFGVSLLFFALLLGGGNCQEELDLTIANVVLVLGWRCCAGVICFCQRRDKGEWEWMSAKKQEREDLSQSGTPLRPARTQWHCKDYYCSGQGPYIYGLCVCVHSA